MTAVCIKVITGTGEVTAGVDSHIAVCSVVLAVTARSGDTAGGVRALVGLRRVDNFGFASSSVGVFCDAAALFGVGVLLGTAGQSFLKTGVGVRVAGVGLSASSKGHGRDQRKGHENG